LLTSVKLIASYLFAGKLLPKLNANLENLLVRQFLKLDYILEALADSIDGLEYFAVEVVE
jgi:hypothetical protein